MDFYAKAKQLRDKDFKQMVEVEKATLDEKRENCRILQERILIENINAKIKVFRIMKYPYRNSRCVTAYV